MNKSKTSGDEIYSLIEKLYPICRSITGNGTRETMQIINKIIPLDISEVKTGTKVFDWTVPKEWNINDAYIKNSKGEKIIDFHQSNLHVLHYSVPVHKTLSLEELKSHLFTIPEQPDLIPYRTSYYNENWGFCLSHNQYQSLEEGAYEVNIDSTLSEGSLTYAEWYKKGILEDEFILSCHICHPSLCNDNLSSIGIAVGLAKYLRRLNTRYSYRILFIPVTIGSITWLAKNEPNIDKIKHGLVLTNLGDSGGFTYKKSRRGDYDIDKIVNYILSALAENSKIIDFYPYGYDERQFCSPGFDLPFGTLSRTPHGQYPEYHTSGDNLNFVSPKNLDESFNVLKNIINTIEKNKKYINTNPRCEPQLGKRGLYQKIAGETQSDAKKIQMALLWVLNYSDGQHSLLDIAIKSGIEFLNIKKAADALFECNLLKEELSE